MYDQTIILAVMLQSELLLYKHMYKSRYLSLNMIPHRQLVLYMGNASREEFIPKES